MSWKTIIKRGIVHFIGGLLVSGLVVMIISCVSDFPEWARLLYGVLLGTGPAIKNIRDAGKGEKVKKMLLDLLGWFAGSIAGGLIALRFLVVC